MSLLTDILGEVYKITSRSDLVEETKLAIRQATLAAHRCEKFRRDIFEGLITPGKPLDGSAIYQLDLDTYFPSYRAFKYLRPYDSVGASASRILIATDAFLEPDAILDEYGEAKVNVAYVAGSNVNIRLEAAYDSFLTGYYRNPVISPDDSYESWIARLHPEVIIIHASMNIYNDIGMEEAGNKLKDMLFGRGGDMHNIIGGYYMLLKTSNVEDAGR